MKMKEKGKIKTLLVKLPRSSYNALLDECNMNSSRTTPAYNVSMGYLWSSFLTTISSGALKILHHHSSQAQKAVWACVCLHTCA